MVFQIFRRGGKPAPEAKASATGPVIAYQTSGRVAWSPRDALSLTRTGFTANPVGFRCVRLIAEAAAAVPLQLLEDGRRFDTHPLIGLIDRPNPLQSRAEFFEAIFGHLMLSGNAYVEAVAGNGALPEELHVLRSDRMHLVPGADGWPVAYEYAVGGKRHVFRLGDGPSPVCHVRSFHPQDDHYGLSPMQAAASAVDVHNSASRWSKALLDNAARPSGAIVYRGADGQGALSSDQYDRLLSEMEAHHQGARNAGRPMLLEGGPDWKPMGFSPSDMEFQKTKEAAAREIALAFGVPPMLLGIPGDNTYANYQEAHRAFYRPTVVPLVQRVTAAVSHWLNGWSGGMSVFRPDLDQVPALAAERDGLWRRIGAADFLSETEKTAAAGASPARRGGRPMTHPTLGREDGLEHKYCGQGDAISLKDGHVIEGYASVFGQCDRGGDIVQKGAYTNSLKTLQAEGRRVRMLWQHDPSQPIGVWDELREDARGLYMKGRLLDGIRQGHEAGVLLEAGAIDGLSIGYRTIRARKDEKGRRILADLELWEVSLVTFPMLPEARVGSKGEEPGTDLLRDLAAVFQDARHKLALG